MVQVALTDSSGRPSSVRPDARLSVTIVAQAAPALGGVPSFVAGLMDNQMLARSCRLRLLNTTRQVERSAGRLTGGNLTSVVVDSFRTFRAARECDVIHIQTALMPLLPLLRALALCSAGRLGRARVICHVHSGRVNSGQPGAFDPGPGIRFLLRGLRIADFVCTVSDAGTRVLRELVPGTRVETVDNAVDVEAFPLAHPTHQPARLLYVGTLSRRKGMADLLAALEILGRDADRWSLEIVGGAAEVGASEAGALQQAVISAGLQDSLVGSLPPSEIPQRLADADIFVLPSHWEGQPIAILEAMAAGLAVVATCVGANPDVIRDGQDGVLVPPNDPAALACSLSALIAAPERRLTLGRSARERVSERHTQSVLGARMTTIYHQVGQHR
jgi:glycosyltransferase involved in cell wall biosynthesis